MIKIHTARFTSDTLYPASVVLQCKLRAKLKEINVYMGVVTPE